MPCYVYTDPDGDQIALPCTERMYSERAAVGVANFGVMPLLSLRGRPELRLGGFNAVAGPPLAGFWAPVTVAPPSVAAPAQAAPEPEASAPIQQVADAPPVHDVAPEEPQAAASAPAPAAEDDLDALLASLNVEPPPPAEDSTDIDLDALLASLQ
jgi:type VI secretion system protein ImpC